MKGTFGTDKKYSQVVYFYKIYNYTKFSRHLKQEEYAKNP
jgi:hypothetical protein